MSQKSYNQTSLSPENSFRRVGEINRAAVFWYGRATLDNCCLAENRLHRGEEPKRNIIGLVDFNGSVKLQNE